MPSWLRRAAAFVFQWTLWVIVTLTIVEYKPVWDHRVHGWGRECLAFAVWLVLSGVIYFLSELIRGSSAPTPEGKPERLTR